MNADRILYTSYMSEKNFTHIKYFFSNLECRELQLTPIERLEWLEAQFLILIQGTCKVTLLEKNDRKRLKTIDLES